MIASRDGWTLWLAQFAPMVLVLAACSVDPKANSRYHAECDKSQRYRGFCKDGDGGASVSAPDAGASSGDGSASVADGGGGGGSGGSGGSSGGGSGGHGGSGSSDAGHEEDVTGQPCSSEGDTDPCYTGPRGSDQFGNCRPGMRTCNNHVWGECLSQVLPQPEICNNADDDCDDSTDEDLESFGTCTIAGAPCGAVLSCISGTPVCAVSADPAAETCNSKDDDCDGKTDEAADEPCATGNDGCAPDGSGGYDCKGICKAGIQHCVGGVLKGECEGQVKPESAEICDASGPAADDDCNGSADDTCTCSNGASQPCYNGPDNTLKPGAACHAGTQGCAGGKWGDCVDEQGPVDETCDNPDSDDDCNGTKDDVPMLGATCTTESPGICHTGKLQCASGELRCIGKSPADEICNTFDDDCDGKTDEDSSLQTDKNNCGACGTKCTAEQTCCGGKCTDTRSNPNNCASCGMFCGNCVGCCSSQCRVLSNNPQHCGACGNVCDTDNGEKCCGNACFNTDSDEANCGTCGHACAQGQACCDGQCKALGSILGLCTI